MLLLYVFKVVVFLLANYEIGSRLRLLPAMSCSTRLAPFFATFFLKGFPAELSKNSCMVSGLLKQSFQLMTNCHAL